MPEERTLSKYITEDGPTKRRLTEIWQWLTSTLQLFGGYETEISVSRPTRSNDQNALLWGVVYPAVHQGLRDAGVTEMHLMDEDGEAIELPITVRMIHLVMKHKYIEPDAPGEEPTTTTLTTTSMHRYIENIRLDPWVQRYDIHVPMPNQPPPEAYES